MPHGCPPTPAEYASRDARFVQRSSESAGYREQVRWPFEADVGCSRGRDSTSVLSLKFVQEMIFGLVSGRDFSRAVQGAKKMDFSP